ncbi:MAG: hypothetical protein IPI20_16720 [Rhodoferax sp.]|nr:hypothetical protein [Rhodoferax sp.]
MNVFQLFTQGDGVSKSSNTVAAGHVGEQLGGDLWKSWLLHRASGDVARSTAAFWQSCVGR